MTRLSTGQILAGSGWPNSANFTFIFDYMTHGLLIAKLYGLNFDVNALKVIFDYLTGRKQRVKINSSFSSYLDIFQSVPQELILGPLLFSLFLCNLFLFVEEDDITSYADDNTPYVCCENVGVTLETLEEVGKVLSEWFSNNFFRASADSHHILSTDEPFATINEVIKKSNDKKLN